MLLSIFRVSGHSMEPTIIEGHLVVVSAIPYIFNKPQIGDVVVFRRDGKMFLKRVEKKEGTKYFLAGDNKKDSLDSRKTGWINKDNIVGKVVL